jgi:hypothetical protein
MMTPMTPQEMLLVGSGVMGFLIQRLARAPKSVPAWVTWAVIVVAGVAVYVWATPDFGNIFAANWRMALAGAVGFLLQVRGSASTASDTKVAPATDSR